jgi:hypothetical protein
VQANHPSRQILKYQIVFMGLLILALGSCTLEPPEKKIPVKNIKVSGQGIEVQVRSSDGLISGLIHKNSASDIRGEQPDSLDTPVFGIEIYDELDKILYSEFRDSSFISDFEESQDGISYSKAFKNAPFTLNKKISRDEQGVYLNCRAVCEDLETPMRSVRCTYLIPVPSGYSFWVPGMEDPLILDGETAAVYRYGCGESGGKATGIPLAVLWKPGGSGLSVAIPLEIKTARVIFSIETALHSQPPAGSYPTSRDINYFRVTFDLVGLGPDRPLETGLWIYSHEDDWRPALRIFAEKYREAFTASSQATGLAGIIGNVEPAGADPPAIRRMLQRNVSLANIGWNFHRYGQWIPPQAVRFSDFTWNCRIDPQKYAGISVQQIRFLLDALRIAKLQPVLYSAYNQRCEPDLAENLFRTDITRNELGKPLKCNEGNPLMHATPSSRYGRQILEQQRQMIELYPEATGFFFDDLNVAGVDFAHNDGLTVVHNRPAHDIGKTFSLLGPALTQMVHDTGKLVLANVPSTISSCEGIDIFCLEGTDNFGNAALMSLNRPTVSLPLSGDPLNAEKIEYRIQHHLVWGVMPSAGLIAANPMLSAAYRPLYLSLKGRQWVLEPHALRLPEGIRGQIFRAPSTDRPGRNDLQITVVRPGVLLADESRRRGVIVRIRVPDAEYLARAFWTPAASPAWPVPLKPVYNQGELSVELPPFGPAGVLRLSRR